jgi:hypothetical protein
MKIKKNYIINALYVVLVVLALIGIYKIKQISKRNIEKRVEEIKNTVSPEPVRESVLENLLKNDKPVQCTFAQNAGDTKTNGTIFISSEAVRIDVTAPDAAKKPKLGHYIVTKAANYFWY